MRWLRAHPLVALSLAGGVVIVVGVVIGLVAFGVQRDAALDELRFGDQRSPDALAVDAHIVRVDPGAEEVIMRLGFVPVGDVASPDRLTPAHDLTVLVGTTKGSLTLSFPAGQLMSGSELTLRLRGGAQLDYPFDDYDADLVVYAEDAGEPIPIRGRLSPGLTGFRIAATRAQLLGAPIERLHVQRVQSTVVFAVFVMIVLWLLAVGGLIIAIAMARGLIAMDTTVATFLGALLFSFPLIRQALPGAPPIGARFDFLSFFWAEALIVVAVLIAIGAWMRREGRRPASGGGAG